MNEQILPDMRALARVLFFFSVYFKLLPCASAFYMKLIDLSKFFWGGLFCYFDGFKEIFANICVKTCIKYSIKLYLISVTIITIDIKNV